MPTPLDQFNALSEDLQNEVVGQFNTAIKLKCEVWDTLREIEHTLECEIEEGELDVYSGDDAQLDVEQFRQFLQDRECED